MNNTGHNEVNVTSKFTHKNYNKQYLANVLYKTNKKHTCIHPYTHTHVHTVLNISTLLSLSSAPLLSAQRPWRILSVSFPCSALLSSFCQFVCPAANLLFLFNLSSHWALHFVVFLFISVSLLSTFASSAFPVSPVSAALHFSLKSSLFLFSSWTLSLYHSLCLYIYPPPFIFYLSSPLSFLSTAVLPFRLSNSVMCSLGCSLFLLLQYLTCLKVFFVQKILNSIPPLLLCCPFLNSRSSPDGLFQCVVFSSPHGIWTFNHHGGFNCMQHIRQLISTAHLLHRTSGGFSV